MDTVLLMVAGAGGLLISLAHGRLGQRMILSRITGLSDGSRRINQAVFQLSTLYWFLGGVLLMLAPFVFEPAVRTAVVVLVAGAYLAGGLGNIWAMRGRHFGGPLLIAVGITAIIGV